MRNAAALPVVFMLGGCATTADPNYLASLEAYRLAITSQRSVELAKASAEEARFTALAAIAQQGDAQSRQLAILALALARGQGADARSLAVTLPTAPPSQEERALKWASVIMPTVATLGMGYWGYSLGKVQSNNSAAVSIAGYDAIKGVAGAGFGALASFKPVPFDFEALRPDIITTTTTTTTTNVTNDEGLVAVGTQGSIGQDNSPPAPVVVVPPVTIVQPVVPTVPVVVTNP